MCLAAADYPKETPPRLEVVYVLFSYTHKHTFALKVRDRAGNDSTIVTRSWTVDTTSPTITFSTQQNRLVNSRSAAIAFSKIVGLEVTPLIPCTRISSSRPPVATSRVRLSYQAL